MDRQLEAFAQEFKEGQRLLEKAKDMNPQGALAFATRARAHFAAAELIRTQQWVEMNDNDREAMKNTPRPGNPRRAGGSRGSYGVDTLP